jgi:hypothetical protein
VLYATGRATEAVVEMREARRLIPSPPPSAIWTASSLLLRRTVARREPLVTEISVPCDDGFARCATMRGSAN